MNEISTDAVLQLQAAIEQLTGRIELLMTLESQRKAVLNSDEAARYLDISKTHLYTLTSQRRVPYYKPEGKQIFFKKSELDAWKLRNRHKTDDEIHQAAKQYTQQTKPEIHA